MGVWKEPLLRGQLLAWIGHRRERLRNKALILGAVATLRSQNATAYKLLPVVGEKFARSESARAAIAMAEMSKCHAEAMKYDEVEFTIRVEPWA